MAAEFQKVADELWRRFMAGEYGPANVEFVQRFIKLAVEVTLELYGPSTNFPAQIREDIECEMLRRLEAKNGD